MRHLLTVTCLLCAPGCKVDDAPDSIEALAVFGFRTFDDADDPVIAAEGLTPLIADHADALAQGLRVDAMTQEDLTDAGVDREIDARIVGVAAIVDMTSTVDDVARAWSFRHMQDVIETTLEFQVTERDGSRSCFLAHECDTYGNSGVRTLDLGLFGSASQVFSRDYRWVTLDSGDVVLVLRELVPDGSDGGSLVAVHQQYSYSLVAAHDGGARRFDTFWIDAEAIGIDLPDAFALDFAVSGMTKTAADVDAWVEAHP